MFIMVRQAPAKLLPTIISRTQGVAVPALDTADIEAYLAERYGLEGDRLNSISRLSGGNLLEGVRLAQGDGENSSHEYFELFASLMRFSYNDRHMELLDWGDRVAAMGREQQKQFLQYSVGMLRENYMMNAGMRDITYLWGDELAFSEKFSPFIGNHNIEQLVSELELTLSQVVQNGNPRIIFPHMALAVSKMIVKQK